MSISLQEIITELNDHRWQEAYEKCQTWLQQAPDNPEASHLFGLLLAQSGKISESIQYFLSAIRLDPHQAVYHNNLSNAYKTIGHLEASLQCLQEALRLNPHYAEAHHNLGCLYYTQSRLKEAVPAFEKALRLHPQYWEAHYSLANALAKLDQTVRAIEHYEIVLKFHPTHGPTQQNLGMLYWMHRRYPEALPLIQATLQRFSEDIRIEANVQQPSDFSELQAILADVYLQLGQTETAIQQHEKALSFLSNRNRPELHHNLAILYLREQNKNKALQHFSKALELQPDNDTARHFCLALQGTQDTQAPAQYVADLFDQYAPYYDEQLKEQLHYQAPALLRNAVGRTLSPHSKLKKILDVGCGTGLCGIYFQDLAEWLVGVDLSQGMLVHAKHRGAYHALCRANILQALPGFQQHCFDLIVAADVLVYLGNLKMLFQQISTTLQTSGQFAFTIEEAPATVVEYQLQATGRYAHATSYIHTLAQQNGFLIELEEKIILRQQRNQTIAGVLFILVLEK